MTWATLNVKGIEDVAKRLDKYGKDANRAAHSAIVAAGADIGARADAIVPEDLGPLRASQHMTIPKVGNKMMTLAIRYGGPSEQYALAQHERMDYVHPKGGQAKYLEEPFLEETDAWPARFMDRMKAAGMGI
jgi:hypothetical protein